MPPTHHALRDAHLHLAEHGEELSCISLADCASRDEALQRIARAADERDPGSGSWLKAVAARVEAWKDPAWPTAHQLDEAVGGVPVVILSFDHHALVASSAALAASGIIPDTPDPQGGVIERDGRTPTGLVLEEAAWIVRRAMPAPSERETLEHLRTALADLRLRGFVEVHDMLARPLVARLLLELERDGQLDMHVRLYATRESFDILADQCERWESERVRLAGLKIFTDGTLNSRTASMLHPFEQPRPGFPRGTALMSEQDIADAISHADARGYPIAAHAIGDAAVRRTLDAVERITPGVIGQRIEHAQFIDEADIPRFAELGVVASVQPCHLLTDVEAIHKYAPSRAERAFPLRDLIDSIEGAGYDAADLLWLGSDAPIVPPSPHDNLQASVERRRSGAPEEQAIAPRQAITADEWRACSVARVQD